MIQHFVFATHNLIDFLVPDIPEELDIAIKKEAYLAKKAMSDHPLLTRADTINTEDENYDQNFDVMV